jgi:hypothetical protein
MAAIITTGRWEATHADYKTGSPTEGTAAILRLTTDRGTILVPVSVVDRPQLFDLGPVVATPGARRALARAGAGPAPLLARHAQGDWGSLCDEDHDANDQAVRNGDRILSAYEVKGTWVWVITDAVTDGPATPIGLRPRYATTVLLPSEY